MSFSGHSWLMLAPAVPWIQGKYLVLAFLMKVQQKHMEQPNVKAS